MNKSNTENDNDQAVVSSIEIAKADIVSLEDSPISSIGAVTEIESIAEQIDTSSKEQLSKLTDIEQAIKGISIASTSESDHSLAIPVVVKASQIIKSSKAFSRVKTSDSVKVSDNASVNISKEFVNNSKESKAVVEQVSNTNSLIEKQSKVDTAKAEKTIITSDVASVEKVSTDSVENNKSTTEEVPTIKAAKEVAKATKTINKLYQDERGKWRNENGSFASEDAIKQQKENTNKDDDKEKGFLGKIVEVATGGGRGEEGKGALGRVAFGSFYDMGVEALDISKDAMGYVSKAGDVFKDDEGKKKEDVDTVKSDDVIKGKKDDQTDIKDELDDQTALLKEIADKDFSGGDSGSIIDDVTELAGGGKDSKTKASTKKRGRIGRVFDKLKSKSPKLAKASGFLGAGVDKVKGFFGRGAASGGAAAAQSAGGMGSKVLGFAGKALSKIAAPLTVAVAGYTKHQELKSREDLSDNQKNTITASTAVGAGGGMVGGAAAGAAIGTMIFPVIGTAIGGLIGGALGAWAGGEGGSMAGEAIASVMESPVKTIEKESNTSTELANPFGGNDVKNEVNNSDPTNTNKVTSSTINTKKNTSSGTTNINDESAISKGRDISIVSATATPIKEISHNVEGVGSQPTIIDSPVDSVGLAPAVDLSTVEKIESIRASSTVSNNASNTSSNESPVVVKNDPALVDEMKKINSNLTKANNKPVKRERNKSVVPYSIPKSFDNDTLKLIAMDIR